MDALDIVDPMMRGGAATLFLLWIAILWRDPRAEAAARVAIAMNVAIIAFLLARVLDPAGPTAAFYLIADALSVMVPALFWLFARLWFEDRRRIGWRSRALVGGFALLPLIQLVLIAVTGEISWALWLLVRAGMFGFALAAMWIAWRGRGSDLVESRRRVRLWLVGAIGLFVLWVSFLEMFHFRDMNHDAARSATLAAILAATFAVSVGLYRFRQAALFAATVGAAPPQAAGAAEPSPLARRIDALMAEERAYRAEAFGIASLARQLGEPEYRVRRAINGEMGFRNFTAYLNSYRLADVRTALADPAQRDVPILTIAIDAGFDSLGPFNRAFRDAEGMTPSEFRARALADSGIG